MVRTERRVTSRLGLEGEFGGMLLERYQER
jgi:hypothetical protein